jgi:hypothetical protein
MAHALTLFEAVDIYANGRVSSMQRRMEIVAAIASDYQIICREVEDKIAFLARQAGKPLETSR